MNELIATVFTLGISALGALGLFYKNVRESNTKAAAAAEALREKEQERITKVLGLVQEQLEKTLTRLDATETECAELRTQQNLNIKEIALMSTEVTQLLTDNQRLAKEVEALRAQLATKDAVIQEQDGRIKQQEKRIHELESEYKKVQGQVDELTAKLREAEVKLKESGGGTG